MASVTKWLPHVGRVLLGLPFFVFGLNYFIPFMPMPPPPEGPQGAFFAGLVVTHILAAAKVVEVVSGLLLLANRFVPLALTILAPVLIAIVLINAAYNPSQLGLPIVLVLIELALAWHHRHAFAGVLRAKATPEVATDAKGQRVPAASAAT